MFGRLGRREVEHIAGLMMAETKGRAAAKGLRLHVDRPLMDKITAEGYSEEYGVRPLRQAIVRCGALGGGRAGPAGYG